MLKAYWGCEIESTLPAGIIKMANPEKSDLAIENQLKSNSYALIIATKKHNANIRDGVAKYVFWYISSERSDFLSKLQNYVGMLKDNGFNDDNSNAEHYIISDTEPSYLKVQDINFHWMKSSIFLIEVPKYSVNDFPNYKPYPSMEYALEKPNDPQYHIPVESLVMSSEKIDELIGQNFYGKKAYPSISRYDPEIFWLGFQIGDFVCITTNNNRTAFETRYYNIR